MTPDMMAIITVGVALGGLMITLLQRLDKRIDGLDKRIDGLDKRVGALDKRINDNYRELSQRINDNHRELGQRVGGLEKEVAALKATVETFFRVRIDPPPPGSEHHDQAA